jgi:hypothetical protein
VQPGLVGVVHEVEMILLLQCFLSEQIYNSFVYLLGWQENVFFFSLKGKAVTSIVMEAKDLLANFFS